MGLRNGRGAVKMSCKCAKRTDEYNGWECEITEGPCMYMIPDSKRCAKNTEKDQMQRR